MYNTPSRTALIALLFVLLSLSAFSQRRPAIDPCAASRNNLEFTFRPVSTRVEQGRDLAFSVSAIYTAGRGSTPAYSGVWREIDLTRGGRSLRLDGPWYAIYSPAGRYPRDEGIELTPVPGDQLPDVEREIDVWPDYYSGDVPLRSTVKRLSGLRLGTAGMEPGYYWLTLQSNAYFDSPYGASCAHMSRPVLIEIAPSRAVNHRPTIRITATAKDCGEVTAAARVSDPDGQELAVDWEITDKKGRPVEPDHISEDGRMVVLEPDAADGAYTFRATVSDPGDLTASATATARYICSGDAGGYSYRGVPGDPPYPVSGGEWKRAGTRYSPPLPSDSGRWARYYPESPEAWYPSRDRYPEDDLALYYRRAGAREPDDETFVHNNAARLDEIAALIHDRPGSMLKIFAYSEFDKNNSYAKTARAWLRANDVRDYLIYRYEQKYGGDISGRLFARAVYESAEEKRGWWCERNKWPDPLRYDRRTLLVFTRDRNLLPPSPDPGCAPPKPAAKRPRRGKR